MVMRHVMMVTSVLWWRREVLGRDRKLENSHWVHSEAESREVRDVALFPDGGRNLSNARDSAHTPLHPRQECQKQDLKRDSGLVLSHVIRETRERQQGT
jgi:hypothetical protein